MSRTFIDLIQGKNRYKIPSGHVKVTQLNEEFEMELDDHGGWIRIIPTPSFHVQHAIMIETDDGEEESTK